MKLRVLLVDDEEKFVVVLAKRLAMREIDVDYVFSGQDAIHKVETGQYDVAILDVKMPGISGVELKRRLDQLAPGMKVIFLTGHGDNLEINSQAAEDAVYLAKPLQIDNLVQLLSQLAGKQDG